MEEMTIAHTEQHLVVAKENYASFKLRYTPVEKIEYIYLLDLKREQVRHGNKYIDTGIVSCDGSINVKLSRSNMITETTFTYNPQNDEMRLHPKWDYRTVVVFYYRKIEFDKVKVLYSYAKDYRKISDDDLMNFSMPKCSDIRMPAMPTINV